MTHYNPLPEVARHMAEQSKGKDEQVFRTVALCGMMTMAATGAAQTMLHLVRELRHGGRG